jgi:hypothetical protein
LWHFLLWIPIRARVSYSGMHWICGAITVEPALLLVFKSPFPRYLAGGPFDKLCLSNSLSTGLCEIHGDPRVFTLRTGGL